MRMEGGRGRKRSKQLQQKPKVEAYYVNNSQVASVGWSKRMNEEQRGKESQGLVQLCRPS